MALRIVEVRWQWLSWLAQKGQPLHRGRTISLLTLAIRTAKVRHDRDQEEIGAALYLTEDRKVALSSAALKVESGA